MKISITLDSAEIQEAVADYITRKSGLANPKPGDVTLIAGRGKNEFNAIVSTGNEATAAALDNGKVLPKIQPSEPKKEEAPASPPVQEASGKDADKSDDPFASQPSTTAEADALFGDPGSLDEGEAAPAASEPAASAEITEQDTADAEPANNDPADINSLFS